MKQTFDRLGISVFQRGWLSSNNILLQGGGPSALVDSGYCTHAQQTVELVKATLGTQPLDLLLNTHLHSDHCGGNAALQQFFPELQTLIPPGHAHAVKDWNPEVLTHQPTGQLCPRFGFEGLISSGQSVRLGPAVWEVHAAKGHDPHSVILFQPDEKVLISADALWERGFGVVFPELEGKDAFQDVSQTLDLIERLDPVFVIPGHGAPFQSLGTALGQARSRLEYFILHPDKHHRHALKVLIKFKLLEWQSASMRDLLNWYEQTPYIAMVEQQSSSKSHPTLEGRLQELLGELQQSGAIHRTGDFITNT